jgi:hypothetical protein
MEKVDIFDDLMITFNIPRTRGTEVIMNFYRNEVQKNIQNKELDIKQLKAKLENAEKAIKEMRKNGEKE